MLQLNNYDQDPYSDSLGPTNGSFTFSANDPEVRKAKQGYVSPTPSAPCVRRTPGAEMGLYQAIKQLHINMNLSKSDSLFDENATLGQYADSSPMEPKPYSLWGFNPQDPNLSLGSNPPSMLNQGRAPLQPAHGHYNIQPAQNYHQAQPHMYMNPAAPPLSCANPSGYPPRAHYPVFNNSPPQYSLFPQPGSLSDSSLAQNSSHHSYPSMEMHSLAGSAQNSIPIPVPVQINVSAANAARDRQYAASAGSFPDQGAGSPKKAYKQRRKDEGSSRNDPSDSPTSNLKFKQFYRGFKQKEKEGYSEAKQYAIKHLEILPEKIHWRVFLEMADLAKRENRISEAREFYQKVNQLQPTAAQGWLEYAKMEEECGNLKACKSILNRGLAHCPVNESLMVKCLKHYERMDHLQEARSLLGGLKNVPVDRTWRTIMEGGLLEARQGNIVVAREVFQYLITSVPWYGPIYQEACRFEEKCDEHEHAIRFVEKGLKENPRYGPLWFSALRLHEKLAQGGDLSAIHETIERAMKSISKELIWKLYYEAAQIEERAGNIEISREFYVKSVAHCPDNLLWKVWMGGARTELNYSNIEIARKLLKRALKEVPPKMKAMVLLECSRLEEYAGNIDNARDILAKAKKYTKHEWKVFLESVLLEMRANNLERALKEAKQALEIHTGTGRLWAVMIQLKQSHGIEEQMKVFRKALCEVPKSGEVWCEGARIAIQQKDYLAARKYINFAIQFTPQYGDSFIEYLRLEMLEHGINTDLSAVEQACVNADPNYGALWLHCKKHALDSTRNVVREATRLLRKPNESGICNVATSLVVNQIYQNVHSRSDEERRKAIFL